MIILEYNIHHLPPPRFGSKYENVFFLLKFSFKSKLNSSIALEGEKYPSIVIVGFMPSHSESAKKHLAHVYKVHTRSDAQCLSVIKTVHTHVIMHRLNISVCKYKQE